MWAKLLNEISIAQAAATAVGAQFVLGTNGWCLGPGDDAAYFDQKASTSLVMMNIPLTLSSYFAYFSFSLSLSLSIYLSISLSLSVYTYTCSYGTTPLSPTPQLNDSLN